MREQKKCSAAPRGTTWRRRLLMGTLWLGVAGGAFFWGRCVSLPSATAEPVSARGYVQQNNPPSSGEYGSRPVAYIYGTVPITREDLGEYLIARGGSERLKNLINKRIIEHAAKQKGIEITEAEVNATLSVDIKQMNVELKDFVNVVLKKYNKSLFEWKEDVIKPRLMLEKMCRANVTVSREDIAMAFDAYYGPKIDCQMIIWPKEEKSTVLNKIWPELRKGEKEFDHYARLQVSPSLAAVAGHVKPIGRNTSGNKDIEDALFDLQDGQISQVIDTPEGLVVVKRLKKLDADATKSFEHERAFLEKEVMAKKVAMEIGNMFGKLMVQADPKNFMETASTVKDVQQELKKNGFEVDKSPRTLGESVPSRSLPVPGLPPVNNN